MKSGRVLATLLALTFAVGIPALAAKEEKDVAVPALSDLALLGVQNRTALGQDIGAEQLALAPEAGRLRWLDINRDLQINDFDAKQFQSIVEQLKGETLTGLQLTIRFRGEQKNQGESFPMLYDLDRDAMFTPYDVDYFTDVINQLDEGATRGKELIHKFRHRIFPPALNPEIRSKK
ncbi:MAG: hypothetical protein HY584_05490 [Candidatus Omnitrophica bacterium]|nr:hypothetical protein [Candidatus Omnitrophota bacterium]